MTNLRLEHWKCSNKDTEEHYFLANSERFVAGYNPAYISKAVFEAFLKENGYDVHTGKTDLGEDQAD